MPKELQAHLDQNTVATLQLAAAVRSEARWKKVVVIVIIIASALILWGQSLGRDATTAIQECVTPAPGHEPGECYQRGAEQQGKVLEQIRASQRADLETAVNQFIVSQGGEPVHIVFPDAPAEE